MSRPTLSPTRQLLLETLADRVPRSLRGDCVKVAIDGVDGAGKTIFADELAEVLRPRGRVVLRISADDFLHPRVVRYRRGRTSPEGFWLDSYDYGALQVNVLEGLRAGGSRRYRTAVHDLATDTALDLPWQQAPAGAVLVLDGLFLHRDELIGNWDFSVFLDVPFEETARRMASRDGTHPDPSHPSIARYVEGQRLYIRACKPADRAILVVDNTDFDQPAITASREQTSGAAWLWRPVPGWRCGDTDSVTVLPSPITARTA